MKKLIGSLFVVAALASSASADTVKLTWKKTGEFRSPDGLTLVVAPGCTQSAKAQTARIGVDYRGRQFVTFIDSDGRTEGTCEVTAVVRLKAKRKARN